MGKRKVETEYIWEQQENETPQAYEAFSVYRDMAPVERSLTKVAQQLNKSRTLIGRWSSDHDWQYRVREYDKHLDALALQKANAQIAEMRARHIKIGQMLQTKGIKAIKEHEEQETEFISTKTAVRMIEVGMKTEVAMAEAELAAHTPVTRESAEEESLAKLDEILRGIKSGF